MTTQFCHLPAVLPWQNGRVVVSSAALDVASKVASRCCGDRPRVRSGIWGVLVTPRALFFRELVVAPRAYCF